MALLCESVGGESGMTWNSSLSQHHNPEPSISPRMAELDAILKPKARIRVTPPRRIRSKSPCTRTPWPWPCSLCASNYGCSHREIGLVAWIAREYRWRAKLPHPKQDTRDWLDGVRALYGREL